MADMKKPEGYDAYELRAQWFEWFRATGVKWVTREQALIYTFKFSRERKAFIKALNHALWMRDEEGEDLAISKKMNYLACPETKVKEPYAVAIRYSAFELYLETSMDDIAVQCRENN
jgi:hypothetical protein